MRIESLAEIGRGFNEIEAAIPGMGAALRGLLECPEALQEFLATAAAGPLETWPDRLSARIAELST
jgi:hypothetical protein